MSPALAEYLREGQAAGARYRLGAPRRAPQGTAGSQLGRLAGESLEFMDHREYQPGDDLRRLDWAAYARTDRMIVKLYRQEVCPHLDLVLDGSRSMALEGTEKARAASGLAAALATAAEGAGYSHRVYVAGHGCRPLEGSDGPVAQWQEIPFDAAQSPPEAFRILPPRWRSHAIRVLVSDLLWLGDPLEVLTPLADRAASAYVLQVLAQADAVPEFSGNFRLVDSEDETTAELYVDAAAQARYRARCQRHAEAWRRAARQVGAVFVPLVAETLAAGWDLAPLVEAGLLTM